jgi:AcrR family transcriptional regulator
MPAGRGRPRSEEADRAIIQAALDILASDGYHGLTMEAVAARAGVAKTTVYRRFGSQLDLITELANQVVSPVRRPSTGSLRGDLVAVLREIIGVLEQPLVRRALPRLLAEAREQEELAVTLRRFWNRRRRLTLELLEQAVADGRLSPGRDLEVAADALYGPIYYRYLVTGASLGGDLPDKIVAQVLEGMTSPGR